MMKESLDRVIKYLESYAKEKGIMIDLRSNLQFETVGNGFTVEGILTINNNQYEIFGKFYGRAGLSNFKNDIKLMIDKEYDDINKALSVLARKSSEIKNFSEFIKEIESNIKTEASITMSSIKAEDVIKDKVKIDRLRQKRFLAKRINNYVIYHRLKYNTQIVKSYSSFYESFINNRFYAVLLASLSDEFDDEINDYILELRGYRVYIMNNVLKVEKETAKELAESYNMDPKTKRPLEPLKGVKYVGGDGICLNDSFIEIKC